MNHLLKRIKNPLRLLNHFSIKFLKRKLNGFSALAPYFDKKLGLEIGGPSKIFTNDGYIPLYQIAAKIDGINFSTTTIWENTIYEGNTYNFGGSSNGYQYIQDGTDLRKIESESYDFLLSSHSLEHIANPIKALEEWIRVLKKGGAILVVVPDKRYTFDIKRPVTKFEHLMKDFEENTTEKDLTHLEEVISCHDMSYDKGVKNLNEFKERSLNNFENRCLHHHVFDMNLLEQILKYFNLKIILKNESPPFNLIIMAVK